MAIGHAQSTRLAVAAALIILVGSSAEAAALESQRLARGKEFIAEEQWTRALEEFRTAIADPKEPRRDEALYWLAHCLAETGESSSALATIRRLEREFPGSVWVRPAGALRIQMAVRLKREDVLWWTVAPPGAPVATAPAPPAAPVRPAPAPPVVTPLTPTPAPDPPPPAIPSKPPAPPAFAPPLPSPSSVWISEAHHPDPDLRIQALGYLIRTDADKAIPWLRQIALESENAQQASQAVFVLAQSARLDARETLVQVAQSGREPVRIAAVRELGRFGGPEISQQLLKVYSASGRPVKLQVVRSLGERAEKQALLSIAQTERDRELRNGAIVMLGRAGGHEQLRLLYSRARPEMKRPIIVGLFNARAEGDLIEIAERETDAALRREVLEHLRLLGTPGAKEYLQRVSRNR